MASQIREAEHRIKTLPSGRKNYRFKHMVIGDYIRIPGWDEYHRVICSANKFSQRHQGWDYAAGKFEDGTPVLWRIA